MNFIDECTIYAKAGDGGNGCAAFRREPGNPRGGPAGGDGGHGGSVILLADPQMTTLLDLQVQREYRAERGGHGAGRDRYGRNGEDRLIRVPVGTVVREDGQTEILCDLCEAGQQFIAARGGKGGWGNLHFTTSTNQAPERADPGEAGEIRNLRLELKLLADVGLLGYPNVGKSTLISRVSRARPKIADYPFTTLTPNLGVVSLPIGATHRKNDEDRRSFVLADIPGLIEGAHEGTGLGHRFLRHVSRAKVLIHLLELSPDPTREPERDYDIINQELLRYDEALAQRPQVVVLGKLDVTETREAFAELKERFARRGISLYGISAVTGEGLGPLMEAAWQASLVVR